MSKKTTLVLYLYHYLRAIALAMQIFLMVLWMVTPLVLGIAFFVCIFVIGALIGWFQVIDAYTGSRLFAFILGNAISYGALVGLLQWLPDAIDRISWDE